MSASQETLFGNIGSTYFAEENYAEARKYDLKALALAKKLNEKAAEADDLDDLAQVSLQMGESNAAKTYNEQALAFDRNRPQFLLTTASLARSQRAFGRCELLLRRIVGQKDIDKALQWEADAELANVYTDRHDAAKAESQFQKVLRTLDSARASIHDTENKLAFSSRMARFHDQYIRFLIDHGHPIRALEMVDFIHGRMLSESVGGAQHPVHLPFPGIQQLLRNRGQTVLAYWLGSEKSFVWVVTPSRVRVVELPPRREIEAAIHAYNKALLGPRDVRRSATGIGQKLYRMLVEPVQSLLASNRRVVIIPDRGLYRLNFETLVAPGGSRRYWIEDVQVENASSIMLLARARSKRYEQRQGLLLIGNPESPSSEYPALSHAAEEIQRIADHFPSERSEIISGKAATSSAYLSRTHEPFRYVHFVTHGEASLLSPLESSLILSRGGDSFKLYARDIINAGIHADLVTLSACYGAGTRTYSEGLVGLAWAFMNAGAHQVIAGLWEIDDAATPELMGQFYDELGKGASAAKALRCAKLRMLNSGSLYKRPYYWASLQLYTGS